MAEYAPQFHPEELPEDQKAHREALGGGREEYNAGFHTPEESLFDEREGSAGKVVDLRTGRPLASTSETDEDVVRQLGAIESDQPLPPLPQENDAAARWLEEHDSGQKAA